MCIELIKSGLRGVAAYCGVDVVNGASVTEADPVFGGIIPSACYDGSVLINVVDGIVVLICKVLNDKSGPRREKWIEI